MNDTTQEIAATLADIAVRAHAQVLQHAEALLSADLLAVAWGPAVWDRAQEARARGREIYIEIRAAEDGSPVLTLMAARGDFREALATLHRPIAN